MINDRSSLDRNRSRSTVPAPSSALLSESPEVAAYVRASERVRAALDAQREALAALKALDSTFPMAVSL